MFKFINSLFGLKKNPAEDYFDPTLNLYHGNGELAFTGKAKDLIAILPYVERHEELSRDYHELSGQLFDATSEKIDLLQRIDQLEAHNARLGNGLVEVMQQVTDGANATVKRMANIAAASLKVDD